MGSPHLSPRDCVNVTDLLASVESQGVELWVEGSRLRFRGPRGALTAEQRVDLTSQRDAVVAALRERSAVQVSWQPPSINQRAQWFLHQEAPTSAAYHVGSASRVHDTIDPDALESAVQALSDRHAMLRGTYTLAEDGRLLVRVPGTVASAIGRHAVPGISEDALSAAVDAAYRRPFDLENGPVFRCDLFTRAVDDHVLIFCMHHIAGDAWSLMLLMDEFRALYSEACGHGAPSLARAEHEYAEFVSWQSQMLEGPDGPRLTALWRTALASPRAQIELPPDRPRPPRRTHRASTHPFRLPPAVADGVRRFAREQSTTLYVVLLAAYKAMLFRLTGTQDVVVGTPTFGRTQTEFSRIVGHFVNPVPLRTHLAPEISFRELLTRVARTVRHGLDAQDYPLLLMVQDLNVPRDVARSPLFDVFFGLQAFERAREGVGDAAVASAPARDAAGPRIVPFALRQSEGQFDLSMQLAERDAGLDGFMTFNTDLYDADTIAQVVGHYIALLEGAIVTPDASLEDLPPRAHPAGAEARAPAAPSLLIVQLLDELAARDIRLTLDGEKLKVSAPVGALDEPLKLRLAQAKGEVIAALRDASNGGLRRISRTGPLPISYAQQRLWFLDQMQPGNSHYNIAFPVRMTGSLDLGALTSAIDALPLRHGALRTRIRDVDGAPRADLMDTVGSVVERANVSHLPAAERGSAVQRLAFAFGSRPFDLAVGPLIRALIARVAPDEHVLVLCMHHIASDGWSMSLAFREIGINYDAAVTGQTAHLPPLELQYADFAAWQREQMNSGLLARQLAFWQRELSGAPVVLTLPTDRQRPAVQSYRGTRRRQRMDPALLAAVKAFSRAHDATLYMTMLAAWQVLLHRYSGQEDIVVGSPLANRDAPELEPLIGCFVNNVAMRGRLDGNPTFREFLGRTASVVLGAFDHREVPFDRVVEALRPERSTSHSPIFQALFTLHSFPISPSQPIGLQTELLDLHDGGLGIARFDITLEMDEHEGGLRMVYEYATDLFDEATVARMHGQYLELLRQILTAPELQLSDIPLLTADDRRTLLDEINGTSFEHDRQACIQTMVSAAAAATPDAIAVQAADAILTYAQLERRSNQMAHLLRERGVTDGALVAVCLDRSADLPVALLAVLKAGAAYVPVDPAHPADRIVYTLTDAGVSCVITEERFAPLVADAKAPLLLIDGDDGAIMAQPTRPPDTRVLATDLAYVIYTSGSTGRPKGVEVEHRNVVNFLRCMMREPGFGRDDVLLAVTTPSFDIAGLELFLPLVCGARTVIASRADVLDGEQLVRLLSETGATVMQATPATWRLMIDAGWSGTPKLRALCGGEAMPRDLARDLLSRTAEIWNMYGPTETTIWSTTHKVTDASQDIPIGHPIGNTTVYVLDATGIPSPIGVAGELCIGGEGVARGYRDRPELTAEKFVVISLDGRPPERVYRSGDVVRVRSDLSLEFVGRRDQQVKVRGYRIELGEIESVLVEDPSVRRAVVIAREVSPGDQRLVAYVVPATAGGPLDQDALRALLRSRLPEYMVPSALVPLADLPLTPNGKIDRKALPEPSAAQPSAGPAADIVMTEPQRRVAAIWRDVLRLEHVGVEDNFFDRGGHSLLVVKVHAALRREFQRELTLVDLFQHTTIAAQAALLSSDPSDRADSMQRARARAARQVQG